MRTQGAFLIAGGERGREGGRKKEKRKRKSERESEREERGEVGLAILTFFNNDF